MKFRNSRRQHVTSCPQSGVNAIQGSLEFIPTCTKPFAIPLYKLDLNSGSSKASIVSVSFHPPIMSYDFGSPKWPMMEYYSTHIFMLNVKNLWVYTSLWVLHYTPSSGAHLISIRMEHTRIPLIIIDPITFLFGPHRNEPPLDQRSNLF